MPFVVTHMLVPMILLDIFRDNILKIKKGMLPNKYILVAGLAGLFPDIDLLLGNFVAHRAITHTVWFPIGFLLISSIFYFAKKHDLSKIFLMVFIGMGIHIILDFITTGSIALFYPVNNALFSLNLVSESRSTFVYSSMDAILLWLWFFKTSFRKKIQDIV